MNDKYIEEFCSYLATQKRYSLNTVNAYKRDLTMFFSFLKKENITEVDYISLQSYLSFLYLNNASSRTVCRKISSIKSYAKYLSKNKDINCDFIFKIPSVKREKNLPSYLHKEDLDKLLNMDTNNFLDLRNCLIINLLYSSGMRLSELTSLKLSDYDENNCIFKIKGKGNKERIVIFSNKSKELLDKYLNERKDYSCEYLLINKNNKKLSNRGVELILKNISIKYLGHDKLHPHMLRHTFATNLLNKGMDIRTLQELLGHSSLSATQVYTHIAKSELIDFYTNYHPRSDNDTL